MNYISQHINAIDFIADKDSYLLPHVAYSSDTKTVYFKNKHATDYSAYNKSDYTDPILLNPRNIEVQTDVYINSYAEIALTVDYLYLDGSEETNNDITLYMYVDNDTPNTGIFKYKGLEIPYSIHKLKKPTGGQNILNYTISGSTINFLIAKLSDKLLATMNSDNLYLTIDYRSVASISDNSSTANATHYSWSNGRRFADSQHFKYTKNLLRNDHNIMWRCPMTSDNTLKLSHKLSSDSLSGSFNINDLILPTFLGNHTLSLISYWNEKVGASFNGGYIDYKFVLYSTKGDGRFIHIDAPHFKINNILFSI